MDVGPPSARVAIHGVNNAQSVDPHCMNTPQAQPMTFVAGTRDRRSRTSRPPVLVAFGTAFLAMPVINYIGVACVRGISEPRQILEAMGMVGQIMLVLSLVVGIGLLSRQRWGWTLFLVYAPALVAQNLWAIAAWPSGYNAGAIVQTVIAFGAMGYFLRRDVFAPYLDPIARGWRRSGREAVAMPCAVDGEPMRITNIAAGGCFVEWQNCPKRPGDQVVVSFELGERTWEFRCGVARVMTGGAGLAFRGMTPEQRADLHAAIQRKTKAN